MSKSILQRYGGVRNTNDMHIDEYGFVHKNESSIRDKTPFETIEVTPVPFPKGSVIERIDGEKVYFRGETAIRYLLAPTKQLPLTNALASVLKITIDEIFSGTYGRALVKTSAHYLTYNQASMGADVPQWFADDEAIDAYNKQFNWRCAGWAWKKSEYRTSPSDCPKPERAWVVE